MQSESVKENDSTVGDRQNVSFKFTKKLSKSMAGNKLDESESKAKDYVISVNKKQIQSTAPKEKEKELIIPLIKKNNWRLPVTEENRDLDEDSRLKELAIKEILKETSEKNELWENRDFKNDTIAIPLIMQNKIPEGFETDDKMDVSLRPDESKLEDYEKVPVEKYGLAMLRGMGWKDGDPIGVNSKNAVEPVQVQLRPKGLGLGADASALNKVKDGKNKDEELQLVKGAYVQVLLGSHKGFYGQVLGLDEENARAFVKLCGKDSTNSFSECSLNVVSKKEYEKESKVINRTSYEKYKQKIEEKEKMKSASKDGAKDERREKHKEHKSKEKSSKHEKKREYEHKSSKDRNSDRYESHSKKHCNNERSLDSKHFENGQRSSKSWVRPQLRVRFIDDKYKKGKYFNEKLIVVDVLSSKNCICKTENGKYLEDVSPSMLETVIPRTEPSYVMIVQGKYSGELCTILERNKSKCLATIQFLSDRSQALQIEYDSICEYVGDISQYD